MSTEQFTDADRHMAESIIRTCDAEEAELWEKLIRVLDARESLITETMNESAHSWEQNP